MNGEAVTGPFLCFSGIAPTVGDVAIGQSILHGLASRTSLTIRAFTNKPRVFGALPELAGAELPGPLPAVPLPSMRSPAGPLRLQALARDLRRTGGASLLPRDRYAAIRNALRGCAALVFQGGPNWNDKMITRRAACERLLLLEAARHYGVPVYHVGVSCGPFAWRYPRRLWMAPLCRRALDRHDILFVRDGFSRAALDRLGVTTRIVESTDAAVFLPSAPDPAFADLEGRIRAGARPRVVVSVRDYQATYPAARAGRDRVLRTLARVLDDVQRDMADVFFLSTDNIQRQEKETDTAIAERVQGAMRVAGSIIVRDDVLNPSALKHLYGQFDAMISMRLHPTILALDHAVPCLLLSYDDKCHDFFARLGLGDFAMPLAEFDYDSAVRQVARLLRDAELRPRIRASYEALKAAHARDFEPMYEEILARARSLSAPRAGTEAMAGAT